jgi:hypothetical protein
MLDLSIAPDPVCRLVGWLGENGLKVRSEQADGSLNQHAVWENDSLRVEVTADRGDWSVAIGTPNMSETFHPDEFEAWIDGFPLAGDLSDLDHQVEFITSRWSQVRAAVVGAPRAEDEVRAIGQDYVRRRFGESRD